MSLESLQKRNEITLKFNDSQLENDFLSSYDKGIKEPLKSGIIISLISWWSAIGLIYFIIPDDLIWLGSLTFVYITSYFGFIIYTTYKKSFEGYYQLLGAISNAWAGLFAIYFLDQFPSGEHLVLPVHIFIIFFGLYMIRLRWIAAFIAAFSYIAVYSIYLLTTDLEVGQIILYLFVSWMTLVFALLAGHATEKRTRVDYIQRRTIKNQSKIIEDEKNLLLQEVHHRVKNNLQIIISLIKLQKSKVKSGEVSSALSDIQKRVVSMSLVHQKMHQASNFIDISVLDYTRQLISNVEDEVAQKTNIEININTDITMDIETAIPFGLIINEMISNFHLHCAPNSSAEKSCSLSVLQGDDKKLIVKCSDNGKGFPEGTQVTNEDSIGLELIESLAEQLNGQFKFYNDQGAVYEVAIIVK
jgi:two-component sensor histidine kinase